MTALAFATTTMTGWRRWRAGRGSMRSWMWRKVLPWCYDWSQPVEVLRARLDRNAMRMKPAPEVRIHPFRAEGLRGEWLVPENASLHHAMLWLHGGGYALGSMASHRPMVSYLARATGLPVLLLDYRLAPEHPFPAALDDALMALRWFARSGVDPSRLVIGGDSAGGGLALAAMLARRSAGLALPGFFVGLSPMTDLTFSGETIVTRAAVDPYVTRASLDLTRHYTNGIDPADSLLSPLFGDLAGLPPMLIHVGGDEILLSDSQRLAAKAKAVGVEVDLKVWPRMWHVFHAFAPHMPEANAAMREIGRAVKRWRGDAGDLRYAGKPPEGTRLRALLDAKAA